MFGSKLLTLSSWLWQEEAVAFDPVSMWRAIGWPTKLLIGLVLVIMIGGFAALRRRS